MLGSRIGALALLLAASTAQAQAAPTVPKHQIEVAGIRLGMPAEQARQAAQAGHPGLVFKPLDLAKGKGLSGWIAVRDTPACRSGSRGCEEILRVEHVDGRVFMVSHTRAFAPGEAAPAADTVRASLQARYGPLARPATPAADPDVIERGFTTGGEALAEACTAVWAPSPEGQWIYGFASACDWVFGIDLGRDRSGAVQRVSVLLGDAQAGYRAVGGMSGLHRKAMQAAVDRPRERGAEPARRSSP